MSSQTASRAARAPDRPPVIDPEVDEIIPLMNAASHPLFCQRGRNGQPVGRNALERWRTVGARAADGTTVKLPTFLLSPRCRATSAAAARWFFARLNGTAPASRTPAQARRDHAREDQYLQKVGV